MTMFFLIVGYVIVLMFSIAAAVWAIGCLIECRDRRRERERSRIAAEALREFGCRLVGDSWWFSENVPAMEAVRVVADSLMRSGGLNVDSARNEWRAKIKADAAKRGPTT